MISETTIKDFQEVIEAEYSIQLNTSDARAVLENWVGYFDLLAKINHRRTTPEKE